jgi:hypothetical protein
MAAMLAHGILALSLVVRVHDAYGIPSDHLARARATTAAIMKAAGIAMTWPRCPCLSPVGPGELVVRIARTTPASPPASLGFSFVDTGIKAGTLATVFADRVQALAGLAGVDDGELLGRVIAHEISHLLVGTRDHATQGLMRAEWKASELVRQRPSDWLFSRAESRRIRQAITRRTSMPPPALMIVDADSAPRDHDFKSRFEANP